MNDFSSYSGSYWALLAITGTVTIVIVFSLYVYYLKLMNEAKSAKKDPDGSSVGLHTTWYSIALSAAISVGFFLLIEGFNFLQSCSSIYLMPKSVFISVFWFFFAATVFMIQLSPEIFYNKILDTVIPSFIITGLVFVILAGLLRLWSGAGPDSLNLIILKVSFPVLTILLRLAFWVNKM